MKDEELNTIASEIHQLAGTGDAWAKARKLLRSIEISALREAADKLDQSQTDTPVSDLRCMSTELEKL